MNCVFSITWSSTSRVNCRAKVCRKHSVKFELVLQCCTAASSRSSIAVVHLKAMVDTVVGHVELLVERFFLQPVFGVGVVALELHEESMCFEAVHCRVRIVEKWHTRLIYGARLCLCACRF